MTRDLVATKVWSATLVGPLDVNLAAPPASDLLYRVRSDGVPGTTAVGHPLDAGRSHPVKLANGETLYVKLPHYASADSMPTVATDA